MPDANNTNVNDVASNETDLMPEELKALTPDPPLVEGADPAATPDPAAPPAADPAAAPAAVADPAAAPAAGDPAPAVAAEAVPAAAAPPAPFAPTFSGSAVDFSKELADVEAARTALRDKYKAGDIDDEPYEAEFERLNDLRADLRVQQGVERARAEMSQQGADQSWAYLQRQWLSRPENANINATSSPLLFTAWESAMQMAVNEAATQGKNLSDWELMEAGRIKLVEAGMLGAAAPTPTPTNDGPGPKPAARTAAFSDVPATLSGVPAAADPSARSTVDDMDSVAIEDLEARLAGYTDAQRDALLKQVPGASSFEVN